jgi:hypothetical protein
LQADVLRTSNDQTINHAESNQDKNREDVRVFWSQLHTNAYRRYPQIAQCTRVVGVITFVDHTLTTHTLRYEIECREAAPGEALGPDRRRSTPGWRGRRWPTLMR